ncbi:Leucine Rich Repeat family protein [Histomonas meleagridis]|uniref:Leucine Rich Repeat family protein n=1 Tax=Histomonas meleagridis TaxID=135588 RepID=UPI00355A30B0|nr:Leucine Rich Repeat family protein [Histomonas meleagridis]KAH0804308.1 Leucine Rich Repeat family protein [Histomonas meleagridis]
MIFELCKKLFPQNDVKSNTPIPPLDFDFNLNSSSISGDSFLATVIPRVSPSLIDQITLLYNSLVSAKIIFTQEILTSPLLSYYNKAISDEKRLIDITIEHANLNLSVKNLSTIKSDTFRSIRFSEVSFSLIPEDIVFFANDNNHIITHLSFIKCDLLYPEFKYFIQDLSKYKGLIKSLRISSCNFNESNFRAIFSCMFEAPCFSYLEDLFVSGVDLKIFQILLIQLMGSNTVLTNKCFRVLNIGYCGIDVGYVLPIITLFPTGLKNLSFTNCIFHTVIKEASFQGLNFLDLSFCSFTSESFVSLMMCLSETKGSPITIALNGLHFAESDDFIDSIEKIKNLSLSQLESFSWKSNLVTNSFIDFIANQPKLKEIDISYSIIPNEEDPIKVLSNRFIDMHLKKLTMKASENADNGSDVANLLNRLEKIGGIQSLDITGQMVGEKGIKSLQYLVKIGIEELFFDGNCTDFDTICQLLNNIILSGNVKRSSWPSNDVIKAIELIPSNEQENCKMKLEEIHRSFVAKFGEGTETIQSETEIDVQCTLRKAKEDRLNFVRDVALLNAGLEQIIKECIGSDRNLEESDPLINVYNEMLNTSL